MPILSALLVIAAAKADARFYEPAGSLKDLPVAIRSSLGEMADVGEPFNATDLVDGKPTRRFHSAGALGPSWIVAYEQGGRGYNVQIFQFCDGREVQHWVVPSRLATFADVLARIAPQACRSDRADGA